ncbi:MAG TPA: hypothetical protein VMP01_26055 [Pirellulaceae bacterium]|nr:hypothetical protein [Pirellulaceae bacterium]
MNHPLDQPQQFSIATLLLVTTLIAVCLALFRIEPGLGALSLLFIVPAFLRTLSLAGREKTYGNRLSAREKVAVFLGSLGVTVIVLLTLGVTLMVGNALSFALAHLLVYLHPAVAAFVGLAAMLSSIVLALFAAGWMIRRTYPTREAFFASLRRPVPSTRPSHND